METRCNRALLAPSCHGIRVVLGPVRTASCHITTFFGSASEDPGERSLCLELERRGP